MMRFFEALARIPVQHADDDVPAVAHGDTAYDLDGVIQDFSSAASALDATMLPRVEPPEDLLRTEGRVLADFVVPGEVIDQAQGLQESGALGPMEEWVEGVNEGPWADQVGAVFTRVDEHTEDISERRRETLARWARGRPEEARSYRAVIILAGWQPADAGSETLIEKANYDWLYAVNTDGSAAGLADLEVGRRSLTASPAPERELYEHYGMQLLLPFLYSFALLGCENVEAEPAAPPESFGPRYLRPVVRPLSSAGRADGALRWEIAAASTNPGLGRFAHLDDPDALPDGLGAGLYWAQDG